MRGASRACPLCGSWSRSVAYRKWGYEISRCSGCSLLYLERLAEEDLTLQAEDQGGFAEIYLPFEAGNRARAARNIREVCKWLRPPGRLLDVGCGVAFFLQAVEQAGFEGMGVDINRPMVTYNRQKMGMENVVHGDFATLLLDDFGTFKAVTMWEVFEHVADPLGHLHRAFEVLEPGGILALSTPNVGTPAVRLVGSRWHAFEPSVHVQYWSPSTIKAALQIAGFQVLRVWTRDFDVRLFSELRQPFQTEAFDQETQATNANMVNALRGNKVLMVVREWFNAVMYSMRAEFGDDLFAVARKPIRSPLS